MIRIGAPSRSIVLVLVVCILVNACGPLALYNTTHFSAATAAEYRGLRSHIIEFDDDGYMRASSQLDAALAAMDSAAGGQHRVLTLLFIHGWKNDADASNDNLRAFDNLAVELERDLNCLNRDRPWRVVPIFIGWRGESAWRPHWYNLGLTWPWEQLTFWGRKAAAERVGAGEFQVALSRISEKWRGWRTSQNPSLEFNTLVIAGHSFGGAALLSATVPWLASELEPVASGKASPGAADMIVALNPAIEAGILDKTVLSGQHSLAHDGLPLTRLLVLDARNDKARKVLFPIGRTLSGIFRTSSSHRNWSAERVAAGRPDWQREFELRSEPRDSLAAARLDDACPRSHDMTSDLRDNGKFARLLLRRRRNAIPCRNSVMIIQTTDGLIEGHSGIWNTGTRDFLRVFIGEQQQLLLQQLRLQFNAQ